MNRSQLSSTILAFALTGSLANAHPVTVDGSAAEWFARSANFDNLGIIARNSAEQGEYIWRDNPGDTRTDLSDPEVEGDITAAHFTGTAAGLGILVKLASSTPPSTPVQIQVAIDVDRVTGSGQPLFGGFADTSVSPNAEWEFLVQTRFGSASAAAIYDTNFAVVGTAPTARGADGVEMFVPWSLLGLSGPPATPLRFTVATFRSDASDATIAIGDGTVSNAVDAITDYGDPRAAAYPNSWTELSDQVVDYFFDVHFDPSGEVYSPLLITHFVSDTASTEWVAFRNVSPNPLSLAAFKLGDEETPKAGEGMYSLPASATLAPGATFVAAVSATAYFARFAADPDAEFSATKVSVPDLAKFTIWATGTFALANGGDEVLLLDGSNTLLDVATFGTGAYPGVPSFTPAPAAEKVLMRNAELKDRDSTLLDFSVRDPCGGSLPACGTCNSCSVNACTPIAVGSSCADADLCNGAETCDATGACIAGTPSSCPSAPSCQTCAGATCNPSDGVWTWANLNSGDPCPDGNACNGAETCDGAGTCNPGTPATCPAAPACQTCTGATCNPTDGVWTYGNLGSGTSCSDGDACNGAELCNSSGTCLPGTPLVCSGAPTCQTCVGASCDPGTGNWTFANVTNGDSCGDGNFCNGAETCQSGSCTPGTPLTCTSAPACRTCAGATCDPGTGNWTYPNASPGTSCADGNGCNGDELCDSAGTCLPGTPSSCPAAPACKTCSGATCNPSDGVWSWANLGSGVSCSDGDACNGAEECNGSGACTSGTALTCPTAPACKTCSGASCDPGTGNWTWANAGSGTSCGDGDACNGAETCDGSGTCGSGTALTCPAAPACKTCTGATCNPSDGVWTWANVSSGTSCSDGNVCNGAEACDGSGACSSGTPSVCPAAPTCKTCSGATCDPGTGNWTWADAVSGTSCGDGNACNGAETCNGSGTCLTGAALTCPTAPACKTCSGATCDPANGNWTWANAATGTSCADGDACNGAEECNGSGACLAGTAVACPAAPACKTCTGATCDPGTGSWTWADTASGSSCDDGDACNGAETCDGLGSCDAGTPVSCPAAPACKTCSGATCDPATGAWSWANAASGTSCPDDDACNGLELCDGLGACAASTPLVCNDGDSCTTDSCEPDAGCVFPSTGLCLDAGTDADGGGAGGGGGGGGATASDAGSPGKTGGCGCGAGTPFDAGGATMLVWLALLSARGLRRRRAR